MRKIKITKGKFALVDDMDFDRVNARKWYANRSGNNYYAETNAKNRDTSDKKHLSMHRFILGITDSNIHVDHKDGNPLNNQRLNLRLATYTQNIRNSKSHKGSTSKFKGVSFTPSGNKWRAQIWNNGNVHLGVYKTQKQAATAYNEAALNLHGEFARLNKI